MLTVLSEFLLQQVVYCVEGYMGLIRSRKQGLQQAVISFSMTFRSDYLLVRVEVRRRAQGTWHAGVEQRTLPPGITLPHYFFRAFIPRHAAQPHPACEKTPPQAGKELAEESVYLCVMVQVTRYNLNPEDELNIHQERQQH